MGQDNESSPSSAEDCQKNNREFNLVTFSSHPDGLARRISDRIVETQSNWCRSRGYFPFTITHQIVSLSPSTWGKRKVKRSEKENKITLLKWRTYRHLVAHHQHIHSPHNLPVYSIYGNLWDLSTRARAIPKIIYSPKSFENKVIYMMALDLLEDLSLALRVHTTNTNASECVLYSESMTKLWWREINLNTKQIIIT